MSTAVNNALVYTDGAFKRLNIKILDGHITEMGEDAFDADVDIDARGLFVSPGFVDMHTHLREPGYTHKETISTGTLAAAAGGFTTLCAMPNLSPVPSSRAYLNEELACIKRDALVRVLPYGAISVGEDGLELCDMQGMADAVCGFTDDGRGVVDDSLMEAAMRKAAMLHKPIMSHCEDMRLVPRGGCVNAGSAAQRFSLVGIPAASEYEMLKRDLSLVEQTGARYHMCHISCAESVALIRDAKKRGLPVSAEVTPHQLFFCEDDICEDSGRFKMNPPLRSAEDREALIAALVNGTVDVIATDHAPHTAEEKSHGLQGSAFGVTGLESAFPACYSALVKTGRMSLEALIERMSVIPAHLLGFDNTLRVGAAADMAVFDAAVRSVFHAADGFSMGTSTPFDGQRLTSEIFYTLCAGQVVYARYTDN